MPRPRQIAGALLTAVLLASATPAAAEVSASDVKAQFIPRFARYVTWPPSARPQGSEPINVCVIGSNPFGGKLESAAQAQVIDGHRVAVRRLDSSSGADSCHIAFIAGSRSQSIAQLLASLRGKPILTVTDSAQGGTRGMVHFSVVSGRVRFFIDEAEASRRGLTISSRLLALAIGVKQR